MKEQHIHYNPNYIHHKKPGIGESIREIVFGMEDGMVSTMGAVTGIAIGTGSHVIVMLSGVVIIAVESISMGVGSYLSNKSEREIQIRMLEEEREEIAELPEEEKEEMLKLFVDDGWSSDLAEKMTEETAKKPELMLREMAYRELGVSPDIESAASPIKNGLLMWISYIVGGIVPIIPYFVFSDVSGTVPISITITLIGLFILGVFTTKFSKRSWWKAGLEMFLLAGVAALVGYMVGQVGSQWIR